jgi:hypothetical protein
MFHSFIPSRSQHKPLKMPKQNFLNLVNTKLSFISRCKDLDSVSLPANEKSFPYQNHSTQKYENFHDFSSGINEAIIVTEIVGRLDLHSA